MSKLRNFKLGRKNDGTEVHPNNEYDYELHGQIEDLQRQIQSLQSRNNELNNQVQRLASRAYPDIQRIRDEQRIVRDWVQHIQDTDSYLAHFRNDQVRRIAQKLLEENLIDHTIIPDEPNGDYISRMEIRVQNII